MAIVTFTLNPVDKRSSLYKYVSEFNKEEVSKTFGPLVKILKSCKDEFITRGNVSDLFMRMIDNRHSLKKNELVDVYTSFCTPLDNAFALAELDPGVKSMMEMLARNTDVSSTDLSRCTSQAIAVGITFSWYRYFLLDARIGFAYVISHEYSFFPSDREINFSVGISPKQRSVIFEKLMHLSVDKPMKVTELPPLAELITEDMEADLIENFNYLAGVNIAGNLITGNGHTSTGRLNKLFRNRATADFNTDLIERFDLPSRYQLLGLAYASYATGKSVLSGEATPTDMAAFAKYIVKDMPGSVSGSDFGIMIRTYSGFTRAWASSSYAAPIVACVNKYLKKAGSDWLSLNHFPEYLMSVDNIGKNNPGVFYGVMCLFDYQAISHSSLRPKGDSFASVTTTRESIDWWNDITFPFILQWLRMMCASGLLILATDPTAPLDDPLQGIRYIKFTPLGRFAMGLDKALEPMTDETNPCDDFDLDDENGIVTILKPDSPYITFLNQISQPIGGNRFKITAAGFIIGSKNEEQALGSIDLFRKIVCPKPYGIWQKIIDEAYMRTDITRSDNSTFALYHLNSDIPGLIEFVAGNAEMADNIIKAQDSYVMVKSDFHRRFEELLHKAGYLI